jgi:hypothetical protein
LSLLNDLAEITVRSNVLYAIHPNFIHRIQTILVRPSWCDDAIRCHDAVRTWARIKTLNKQSEK